MDIVTAPGRHALADAAHRQARVFAEMSKMQKMLFRLVLLACALAQQLSAQVPYDSTFSHYARLLNFTLEKSPIGEVQRELGKVQTNDGGDGGDRSERATYYFPLEKSYVTFD